MLHNNKSWPVKKFIQNSFENIYLYFYSSSRKIIETDFFIHKIIVAFEKLLIVTLLFTNI